MADLKAFRVLVKDYSSPLTILLLTFAVTHAAICPPKQYLNSKLQICVNCTDCTDDSVVLRPCEQHRDTYCGPLSAISDLLIGSGSHKHRHEKYRTEKQMDKPEIEWRYGDDVKLDESPHTHVSEALEVSSSEVPFSRAETLVWDWQAIALTSAVFACILFFLVVTLYSLYQARQWKRLKDNFDADVEELSARISLMTATPEKCCEFFEDSRPVLTKATAMATSNYLSNKCIYLEQLLSVRKEDDRDSTKPKGNVYIEENKPKK